MTSNIERCWHHLNLLSQSHNCAGKKRAALVNAILADGGDCLLRALAEIAFNVCKGNCGALKAKDRQRLRRNQKAVFSLAHPKVSLGRKRTVIAQSGGGFLGVLLGAALPVLLEFFTRRLINGAKTRTN